MNIFHLIQKFKKIRSEVYLSAIDQALFYELLSICNESGWEETFSVSSNALCASLNIWDKTLSSSRKTLSDAGLIFFKASRGRGGGCEYSLVKSIPKKEAKSKSKSVTVTDYKEPEICVKSVNNSVTITDYSEEKECFKSVNNSVTVTDLDPIPPYKRIKTIKQENIAQTSLLSPPEKKKPIKPEKKKSPTKKKGDEAELIFPYSSERFLATWEILRHTPKWEKKLNYALQLSLNKLSKFQEEFAIYQMERAIESNWTGVVFPNTQDDYQNWLKNGNNRSCNAAIKPKEAGIKSIRF